MEELASHCEKVRRQRPDSRLMTLFDIDGTILDVRYMARQGSRWGYPEFESRAPRHALAPVPPSSDVVPESLPFVRVAGNTRRTRPPLGLVRVAQGRARRSSRSPGSG